MEDKEESDGLNRLVDQTYMTIAELEHEALKRLLTDPDKKGNKLQDILDWKRLNDDSKRVITLLGDTLNAVHDATEFGHLDRISAQEHMSRIEELQRKVITIPHGSTTKELVAIGDLTKEFYTKMKPLADKLSSIDILTNTMPRSYIIKELELRIHDYITDNRKTFSIICVDFNNLNICNNRFGHSFGDDFLRHGTGYLRKHIDGPIGRTGGDEFLMIIPEVEAELTGKILTERIAKIDAELPNQVIGTRNPDEIKGCPLTLSMGVTSPSISNSHKSIYLRLLNHIRKDQNKKHISSTIKEVLKNNDQSYQIMKNLNQEEREILIDSIRQMLYEEADLASYHAKKTAKENEKKSIYRSEIKVYDPTIPRETFIYHRS